MLLPIRQISTPKDFIVVGFAVSKWSKTLGRGGGVGVECSPTDTEFLGSNPGVDRNFSIFTSIFYSVSVTLTLDIGLSYLPVFPVQFAKLTIGHFFPVLPLISSSVRKLTTLIIVLSVSILYTSL